MKLKVSYANSRIVVDLPMKDSDLNARMKLIGEENTIPWCKLLLVLEDDNPLVRLEGHAVNMDEVNYFARRMESLTEYEKRLLETYVNEHGVESVREMINLTFGINGLSLLTDFSDSKQVGKRLYLDEFMGMTEEEAEQINFVEFAEKIFLEDTVKVLPYGVYVEHGFQMPEVYTGKTFPEYFYSDKIVMALEVQNQSGDTDYLYLPTDRISFNKMKERLGVNEFWECTVTEIHNMRLPKELVPETESVRDIGTLTFLNEFCQMVESFDERKFKNLSMVAEYAGIDKVTDLTYIAMKLNDFEVIPEISNDKEYGKYLVVDSGLFNVDDLILPHIDYAAFAMEKRMSTFESSGYVRGGFVGASKDIQMYLKYTGAFADLLEFDEKYYRDFFLYSPLTAVLYIDDCEEENLYGSELIQYQSEIEKAIANYCFDDSIRGLMFYYARNQELAEKVITANPAVREIGGELYGVLECKISKALTEDDICKLKEYWSGQMSDGWGEGFEQHAIKMNEGELYVSFWNSESFWNIYTEDELPSGQMQGIGMC